MALNERATDFSRFCTYSVRLVQNEPEPLSNRVFVGQIGSPDYAEQRKINKLAEAARVDIAGVASSILATPTIFS
jgi:hypothetical protein